jgi:PIN domain nuclease of toxin-antitoxin system
LSNESYLLDTQILLWMDGRPEKISRRLQASLDAGLEIYFSAASAWEIAIKCSLGKLSIARPLTALTERLSFHEIPVTARYAEIAAKLPLHHKDPFDRMIVAQAIEERLTLVTADSRLASYDLKILQA